MTRSRPAQTPARADATLRPRFVPAAAFAFAAVLLAGPALGQSGSTLTPDRLTYVVSKDVGTERWTINLNLASLDPPRVINATGNVYRSDGAAPSFVWCQVRDDSSGTLSDPNSVFRLRCSGSSACGETATGCARTQWQLIADPVEVQASFFLPDGGNGLAGASAALAPEEPVRTLPGTLDLAGAAPAAQPVAGGGATNRGANLPPDGANFLVNKELGGLRWSISLNQIPAQRGNTAVSTCGDGLDCIVTNRFLNVTGNVYPLDGSAPQFVFCQERQDSTGDLARPESEFRFGCVGTSPCQRSASECAQRDWQPIPGGGDVRIAASFFLPPGGLPATPQSDPEIVIIGRTSDPPAVMVPLGQGASADAPGVVQGGCSEGAACSMPIGSCGGVAGRVVEQPGIGCACLITDVPPECILCGGGATGTCGGECEYQAGGSTARGECLPFSSQSSTCACYAANQSDEVAISICGGSLGSECPEGKCCADDARDGCDPSQGDVDCGGICVDSGGCDPTVSVCGQCLDQREQTTLSCGTLEAPAGASCCEDCPDGTTNCFCEPGRVCNLEEDGGGCCPSSRPDFCQETTCIPSGADCCLDCPDGGVGCYCASGTLCVLEDQGGGCCPRDQPVGCNGTCLAEGSECCEDCPPGEAWCACPAGTLCRLESQGGGCVACPAEAPVNCRNECLPAGTDCCEDQLGGFCEPGLECVIGEDECRVVDGFAATSAPGSSLATRPRRAADGFGLPGFAPRVIDKLAIP